MIGQIRANQRFSQENRVLIRQVHVLAQANHENSDKLNDEAVILAYDHHNNSVATSAHEQAEISKLQRQVKALQKK